MPGDEPRTGEQWAELVRSWWPGLVDTRLRQTTWPQIETHHEFIKSLLGVVTVATIWQRLRDEHGLDVSVASLRRYVRANLPEDALRSRVTVLRDDRRRSGGSDRLRLSGFVAGPLRRPPAAGVGVRDRLALLAARLRAPC